MDIFPIWKTSYYPTTETEAVFRIMKWGTQEIYRGRGRRYPEEPYLDINLNRSTQNTLDSMIWEALGASGDTVALSNGYAEFSLDILDTSTDIWTTVYQFAMVNDWSYEEHEGNIYSDPINGHACPGMVLPYSYLVTGDTAETICYEEVEFDMPWILITPSTIIFDDTGGTLTFTVESNSVWWIYNDTSRWNFSVTSGNSGTTTITVTASSNPYYNNLEYDVKFRARNEYGATTAILHITQEGVEPYFNITSGDGAIFNGHGTGWTLTYNTNVMPAYYELSGSNGYFVTGWTNGGSVTVPILGSLTGDTYEIKFYTEPNGIFLDSATATQQGTGEYFDILSGNGAIFGNGGGTWTITYDTNVIPTYYEYYNGTTTVTGYTSGGTETFAIPTRDEDGEDVTFTVKFYNEEHILLSTATAYQSNEGSYFTMKVLSQYGYLQLDTIMKDPSWPDKTLYYSRDGGATWKKVLIGSNVIYDFDDIQQGDTVYFKGDNPERGLRGYHFRTNDGRWSAKLSGNIMSLLYGDNFVGQTTIIPEYAFANMLLNYTGIIDASGLVLPATTLSKGCYNGMLTTGGHWLMNAPKELPATVLADDCYTSMFYGEALTKAPIIRARTLGRRSMQYMFYGCTSLNYVECYADTSTAPTSQETVFREWMHGVNGLGTFVKASGTTWTTGENGIPTGWTVIDN